MLLIFNHLAAAAVPFIFIAIKRRVRRKHEVGRFQEGFWQRQNAEALEQADVLATEAVPAPPDFVVKWSALNTSPWLQFTT